MPAHMERTKQQWRRTLQARWRQLGQNQLLAASQAALAHLQQTPFWPPARTVMAFFSRTDELPTVNLIHAAHAQGKTVGLPRLTTAGEGEMEVRRVAGFGSLVPGPYRLWEPVVGQHNLLAPAEMQVVIVPGLAFDRQGNRLGRGGGFYDRFLPRLHRPTTVVVAWTLAEFVFDRVPAAAHDEPVDWLVTETGAWAVGSQSR